MATATDITGWLIERRSSLVHLSTGLLTHIVCSAAIGISANGYLSARGAYLTYFDGRQIQSYACSSRVGACMDFEVGDIVQVSVEREPYPDELGIIVSTYPGFAWANYVRFPFSAKEMLISTMWLTRVGKVQE